MISPRTAVSRMVDLQAWKARELQSLAAIEAGIAQLQAQLRCATSPEAAEALTDALAIEQGDLQSVLLNLAAIDRLLSLVE